MNKWLKSFWLHPFANRFNLLYMMGWFGAWAFADIPHAFLAGFAGEVIYLLVRGAIDRSSGNPLAQVRRLPYGMRKRFLEMADKAAAIERDFNAADAESKLLHHSLTQTKRLTLVFLELLLADHRIAVYLGNIKVNFDDKIVALESEAETASGQIKTLAEKNVEIFKKRREKYLQVIEKQQIIKGRLDTIENTLRLLGDMAVGIGQPEDTDSQIELLLTNVQDAEMFVGEIREVVSAMPTPERVR
jgi:hypothetical protein